MKTSLLSWSMVLVAAGLVACGDDSETTSGTGGAGGDATATTTTTGGPTTTTTGGPTTTTTTTSTSSSSDGGGGAGQGGDTTTSANGGGGSGQGGSNNCTEVEPTFLAFDGQNSGENVFIYNGGLDPVLVDAQDAFRIELYDDGGATFNGFTPGTYDLTEGGDENYASCSRCFLIFADNTAEAPQIYFTREGSVTINSVDIDTGTADFTLDGVVLEEVTIDPDTFESSPVAGGECVGVADGDYNPGPSFLCDTTITAGSEQANQCLEAQAGACDAFEACVGTGSDEDITACLDCIGAGGGALCDDALQAIYDSNCFTPTDGSWTCDDAQYWDGETCDCACGTGDPDCGIETNPVEGCAGDEICSGTGQCIPGDWTCNPDFYAATDGCDCNCGVVDPDCEDPDQDVYNCEGDQTCSDAGVCEGAIPGCADQTAVGVDGDFSGDTTTGDVAPSGSCSFGGLSQSFTFTSVLAGDYTITLTSATDQGISVRTDCDDRTTELGCEDAVGGGTDETLVVTLGAAQTVTIVVQAFGDGDEGPFTATIAAN